MNKDIHPHLKFVYEEICRKLGLQNESFNGLVNKINYHFAFAAAALAFYIPTLSSRMAIAGVSNFTKYSGYFAIITLMLSMLFLFIAGSPRNYKDPPAIETLYNPVVFKLPLDKVVEDSVAKMKKGYLENLQLISHMANWITLSSLLLFLGIMFIIASLLL